MPTAFTTRASPVTNTIHVYKAKDQPATKFVTIVQTPFMKHRVWTRYKARMLLPCHLCHKFRWAMNMYAQVYYDGVYFRCATGKGCKAP